MFFLAGLTKAQKLKQLPLAVAISLTRLDRMHHILDGNLLEAYLYAGKPLGKVPAPHPRKLNTQVA
jgi:hypothetical protein